MDKLICDVCGEDLDQPIHEECAAYYVKEDF